ncbi:MAG: LysR family transcriptional regulator [Verrucomicrobia bacterium]|nr:LysR family transcriptional regulator [Verrucomicrobiota bacterium]MDA1006894.1 LysR family transcriptional regulator [Verrucomicrobiota bacterium]
MELRHLQSFLAVMEEGSLSGASQRCHLSQPALSQQMQALEEELGEPLFIRRPRGVIPTPAGELLEQHARNLLDRADDLKGAFRARRELQTGSLVFGVIPTITPYFVPCFLAPFRRSFPGIVVSVTEAMTSELIAATVAGAIEFAVLSDVTSEDRKRWSLSVKNLFREPLWLAAPADHPLAMRKTLPEPSDLKAAELIHLAEGHCLSDRTLRLCRVRTPDQRLECNHLATALAMVSSGMGVSVVPYLASRGREIPNVVFRPFAGQQMFREISLMKRRGGNTSLAGTELMNRLETSGSSLLRMAT